MEVATWVVAALSSGVLGNVFYDLIKRFFSARRSTKIRVQRGNYTVELDARRSEDAEALIAAILARLEDQERATDSRLVDDVPHGEASE